MYIVFNRMTLRERLDESTLRLLTEAEIEHVSGGSGGYGPGGNGGSGGYGGEREIVVVGKRYKQNVTFGYFFLAELPDPGYGYDYDDNASSQSYGTMVPSQTNPPPPPPPAYPPNWNHQRDANIDKINESLKNKIEAKNDDQYHEYLGFVAKDANGNLFETNLVKGTDKGVDLDKLKPSDFGLSSWSQVVAMTHNHPTYINRAPDGQTPQWEVNPTAGMTSGGDMTYLHYFHAVSHDDQYRNYVIHDGKVSEYDWYHNQYVASGGAGGVTEAVKSNYTPEQGQ